MRSADKIGSALQRHVYPAIGDKIIYDLTRADVTRMLDTIAEGSGVPMADVTLGHLNGVLNWWRVRDDDFITMPTIKGMRRSDAEARKGKRKLDIDEIRDVWLALDEIEEGQAPEFFPAYIRMLLLTASRRNDAERCLGHRIKGVEGIYDCHDYRDEKYDAMTKLAMFVLDAVNTVPPSVAKLSSKRKLPRTA